MKRRAYASITVVLLIVIIVTVGLSLVAITKSDTNLAEKKADWTERYYYCEAQLMEGIARLNLALKDEAELPAHEKLMSMVQEIAHFVDGHMEALEGEDHKVIEILYTEEYEEGNMLISARLERAEDGNLRIMSLEQDQEQLEYDSFY